MAIGKWEKYNSTLSTGYSLKSTGYLTNTQASGGDRVYSTYTISSTGIVTGAGSSRIIAVGVTGYLFDSEPDTWASYISNVVAYDSVPGDYRCTRNNYRSERFSTYTQGSFIQYVTAAPGTYPASGRHSDGYWYIYQGLIPPNAPTPLTVPETITGGKVNTITWGAATSDGAAISGYELHRSLDGGTFTRVYRGANRTFDDTVPYGTNTVQYSVRSYDVNNQSSAFTTGAVKNVTNNNPPVITCAATDKGEIADGFTVQYSVTDEDSADSITITEAIDGVALRSFEAVRDTDYTADVTMITWLKLLNGAHTLTITAVDNRGGTAVKSIQFTKAVTVIEFMLTTPLTSDAAATKAMMNMLAVIPPGALVEIFACNNGFDDQPTWIDVTQKLQNGEKIFFQNDTKTADKWGYNVRVKIDRNNATGDCFITSIGGNFE